MSKSPVIFIRVLQKLVREADAKVGYNVRCPCEICEMLRPKDKRVNAEPVEKELEEYLL
jgi:hypothetical protein